MPPVPPRSSAPEFCDSLQAIGSPMHKTTRVAHLRLFRKTRPDLRCATMEKRTLSSLVGSGEENLQSKGIIEAPAARASARKATNPDHSERRGQGSGRCRASTTSRRPPAPELAQAR